MEFDGFEWDEGNWPKCGQHGLSQSEIEAAILSAELVIPDPFPGEPRLRAVGRSSEGRGVFVAFTIRDQEEHRLIRPISARYMHAKEIEDYEQNRPR